MALHYAMSMDEQARPVLNGTVVDLVALRERLELRLFDAERSLGIAREQGTPDLAGEATWIRMLHRYERLCDLLAHGAGVEAPPAA